MNDIAKGRVLIIDDDEGVLRACERVLKGTGYTTSSTELPAEAKTVLQSEPPDVVLLDVKLGAISGLDILKEIKEKTPDVEVIMMTAYATLELAVEAVRAGAYDFLTKPFDSNEKLILAIDKAMEKRKLVARTRELEREVEEKYCYDTIIGKSPTMQEVFRTIRDVAPFDLNVLVQGQSGTGKELIAKAIHYSSKRRQSTFVAINCAALTETLIESELFGHERGAFTGAVEKKKGLFEAAHGGTIFLDEIGEMPLPLQSKLLRVLETGEIRRVGGTDVLKVNVRVIAASNKNLEEEITKEKFREDLYYRLNVVSVTLPPLRERVEDIPLLVRRFISASCKKVGKKGVKIPAGTMEVLLSYPWPGNVRELENAIERAVVLAPGEAIRVDDLPPAIRAGTGSYKPRSASPPPVQYSGHDSGINAQGDPAGCPSSGPGPRPEPSGPAKEEKSPAECTGDSMASDTVFKESTEGNIFIEAGRNYQESKDRAIREFDREYLLSLLKKSGGNISFASQIAGMDRSNFKRLLKKSGLKVKESNPSSSS